MNTTDEIVKLLGDKKQAFLNDVEKSIDSYLSSKSWKDCLTIVLRRSDGSIYSTWYPSEVMNGYTPRFIAFLRKKKYNGYTVDSYLTDAIVKLVTDKFSKFYKDNTQNISKPILNQLLKDHVFVNQLSKQIIEMTNAPLPAAIKGKMVETIVHNLEQTMNTNIASSCGHAIEVATTHIIAVATAIPISKAMLAVMAKSMAVYMKGAIAKVLASTAMKTMMMTTVKKIVAGKMVATLMTLVGAHLGGVSVGWIVAPLLAAFIAYEVASLPEKMGRKVSSAVKAELDGEFKNINTSIANHLVSSMSTSIVSTLASDIAKDDSIKEMLNHLIKGQKR